MTAKQLQTTPPSTQVANAIVFLAAEIPVLALYAEDNEVAVKWWGGMTVRYAVAALLLGTAAWIFAKLD